MRKRNQTPELVRVEAPLLTLIMVDSERVMGSGVIFLRRLAERGYRFANHVDVRAMNNFGAVLRFAARATDGAGIPVPVVFDPPSGSVFQVGVTTVSYSATDPSGRETSGSFTVTVAPAPAV
jgi:hypothetical protein